MMLNFLGRGSGFNDEHTSAYFFSANQEMVIIDCPVSAFQKLKRIDLNGYDKLYVFVTHTHGDHIGGLGLFVQYAFFTLGKLVTIVAPSKSVEKDLLLLLTIEGNESSWYKLMNASDMKNKEWFGECILTKHSPQLDGKCFGYCFTINDTNVVYTGDTSTLQPFIPYLKRNTVLYVDTSVYYGMIHLKLEDALDDLISLTKRGIKVYLMHLDDISEAERIVANYPNINVVAID